MEKGMAVSYEVEMEIRRLWKAIAELRIELLRLMRRQEKLAELLCANAEATLLSFPKAKVEEDR